MTRCGRMIIDKRSDLVRVTDRAMVDIEVVCRLL